MNRSAHASPCDDFATSHKNDPDTRWARCVDLAMRALSGKGRQRAISHIAAEVEWFTGAGHPDVADRARRLLARIA